MNEKRPIRRRIHPIQGVDESAAVAKHAKKKTQRPRLQIADLLHNPVDEYKEAFDGIFAEMARQCGGNPHLAGQIEVSSEHTMFNDPWVVLDHKSECYWYSQDVLHSFLLIDMKENEVNVSGYSLQTSFAPVEGWHLRTWALLGSNDRENWTCIDEVRGSEKLNGRNRWAKFETVQLGYVRYVKLEITDVNWWGDNSLVLTNFELFGDLRRVE